MKFRNFIPMLRMSGVRYRDWRLNVSKWPTVAVWVAPKRTFCTGANRQTHTVRRAEEKADGYGDHCWAGGTSE
jgi:hypothetical protein